MGKTSKNPEHRYVNDLRRLHYSQSEVVRVRSAIVPPIGIALLFLTFVAVFVGHLFGVSKEGSLLIVCAAVVGGYMALNIGANDVANN